MRFKLTSTIVFALATGFGAPALAQQDLEVRASLLGTSRGVFDPGIHRFSTESYVPTVGVRATVKPEGLLGADVSYSYGEVGSELDGGHTLLTSHIVELGGRVESPWPAGPLTPYARAGASLWLARAQFKDFQRYRDWNSSLGIYAGGGFHLGSTLRQTLGASYPDTGIGLTAEVGHVQALSDLEFDPFGTLKMGGLYYSLGLELSF